MGDMCVDELCGTLTTADCSQSVNDVIQVGCPQTRGGAWDAHRVRIIKSLCAIFRSRTRFEVEYLRFHRLDFDESSTTDR